MKIHTQNFITPISQTRPLRKTTNNSSQIVTQPKIEDNLNNIPYNCSNITFGSNVEVITKMKKLVNSTNYQTEDLYKLFNELTETTQNNVRELVKKFAKEGLNTNDYIKACIKEPSLLYRSPETIENNVRRLVAKFAKEGLNTNDYIKACIKQPSLLYRSPETIENNVRKLVAKFAKEGLNTNDYIKACIKRPPLFCLSPETITEHIRAYIYVEQNKGKFSIVQDIMKKSLICSTSLIYLQGIIRPQIIQQSSELSKLGINGLKPRLVGYFKEHPKAQFKIKVLDNDMSGNFVKTMQEFSEKELDRTDAFIYEFVKK